MRTTPATRSGRTTRRSAPGANQPQLDLTNVALSMASPSMLRVKMTVANLAGMRPPPGKANAVWLTRFQALSVGDFGEEAYRIFYVGPSRPVAGAAVLRRLDEVHGHDPQTCKVVDYPRTMAANGRVCGNTISVDVPINGGFGIGLPVGNMLYNVTAFTFGRNDANDIYADVDASHTFDFALGGPSGGRPAERDARYEPGA